MREQFFVNFWPARKEKQNVKQETITKTLRKNSKVKLVYQVFEGEEKRKNERAAIAADNNHKKKTLNTTTATKILYTFKKLLLCFAADWE